MLCYLAVLDSKEECDKFTRLYNKYKIFMWYIARGMLEDDFLSEDAVHEAFLTVTRHLKNIDEEDEKKTKNFLAAVVRCRAIDIMRRRNKAEIINIDDVSDIMADNTDILDEYISEDNYQNLLKCIASLDEKYRTVFELKYVHGLSDESAADVLGLTAKTVNVRMFRARKKLRELLEKEAGHVG